MTAVVVGQHNIGGQAEEPERHDRHGDEMFHHLLRYPSARTHLVPARLQ
jgi:hypothetical protein